MNANNSELIETFITDTRGMPALSNRQAKQCAHITLEYTLQILYGVREKCVESIVAKLGGELQNYDQKISLIQKQLNELC